MGLNVFWANVEPRGEPEHCAVQHDDLRACGFFDLKIAFQTDENMAGWIVFGVRVAHHVHITAFGKLAGPGDVPMIGNIRPSGLALSACQLVLSLGKGLQCLEHLNKGAISVGGNACVVDGDSGWLVRLERSHDGLGTPIGSG